MSDKELCDPIIDEIRAVRHRISAQFDHDPKRLVEHYLELQKRHNDRLLVSSKHAAFENEPAA